MSKIIVIDHCADCPCMIDAERYWGFWKANNHNSQNYCNGASRIIDTHNIPDWCPLEDMKGGE